MNKAFKWTSASWVLRPPTLPSLSFQKWHSGFFSFLGDGQSLIWRIWSTLWMFFKGMVQQDHWVKFMISMFQSELIIVFSLHTTFFFRPTAWLGYLSPPTREWTWATPVKTWSPNHWAVKEFPSPYSQIQQTTGLPDTRESLNIER